MPRLSVGALTRVQCLGKIIIVLGAIRLAEEILTICCPWPLEIQKVKSFLSIEGLVHLFLLLSRLLLSLFCIVH